jgi:signal peptidase I
LGDMQQEPTITQPAPENTPNQLIASGPTNEGWRSIASTVLILALAPLIAWLMITFVFQSYEVDGPSMEETLQDKDRLIVLKTGKTLSRITDSDYIPKRGEVIIFVKHGLVELGTAQDKQLIKRVIGLPGERVVVNDGKITVFNKENPRGFNPDEGKQYAKSITFTNGNVDITVPEGEVFVAGDNRGNSLDSRSFGTVPNEDIIGKLVFRLFPINKAESF